MFVPHIFWFFLTLKKTDFAGEKKNPIKRYYFLLGHTRFLLK